MKKFLFVFLTLITFCFKDVTLVYSQGFNSIHSPDGINVIAAGNSGKIFRSSNSGNTWASYTIPGVDLKYVTSVENDVWIAGSDGKIYKTQKVNSTINSYVVNASVSINSVSFINANTGFVCGNEGSVYSTVNGGINWISKNSGITSVNLNSISFLDAMKGVAVGNNGMVYLTENGGLNWILQNIGTTRNLLKAKYFNDGIAVVGEYGTLLIYQSNTWTSVNSRIVTDIRGVSGLNINDVHICGGGGFIRNNQNGNSRFYNFELNPMMANLVDIFYYDSNTGFAVSSLTPAIIKTSNGGTSWQLTAGSTVTYSWQSKLTGGSGIGNNLCMHPFNRDVMYVVYGSTVYVSRNRGDNWTNIATVTGGGSAHSFYVSPLDTNIWVCAITSSPDRITRTTNYGATWTTVLSKNFSNYGQPLEMDQNNPSNYYFAPDGGGFYRSTDNGASFTEISGNYPFRSPCDIIVTWDSSDVIYIGDGVTGSGQAKIFKTTNNGVNWAEMYAVASSETPSLSNSVFNKTTVYSTEWGGSGFYKTTNYGNNWSLTGSTGSSGWGSDVCHEDPNVVLKGTYGSPTWLTTNAGANFISTSIGGGCGAGIIFPEKGYLLAMQCSGLFKMNITYSVMTNVNLNLNASSVPESFNLYQNYPNPFNPETRIKFDLPVSGNVKLKIYDQLGNEINTLVNGEINAGSYEISFNAAELSSGVYYYSLVTSAGTKSKKMLLMK
ncbi:MAG: hypothetical protein HGGPFJEG_02055 [Ignavibacteria bacterium]|nr:hypothetical protein [Ignavibacteria bacterium]